MDEIKDRDNPSYVNTIHEGDPVILKTSKGKLKVIFAKKKSGRIVFVDKVKIDTLDLIGESYYIRFTVDSDGHVIKVSNQSTDTIPKEDTICGADNRDLCDESANQQLSQDDILKIKQTDVSADDLIGKLIENSKTFATKTQFSQEKYIKKKKNKHEKVFTALYPKPRLLAKMQFMKHPQKTGCMTEEILAQILHGANIRAGINACVVDVSSGAVLACVMEKMAGTGKIMHLHVGDLPQIDILSFLPSHMKTNLTSIPLNKFSNLCSSSNLTAIETKLMRVADCNVTCSNNETSNNVTNFDPLDDSHITNLKELRNEEPPHAAIDKDYLLYKDTSILDKSTNFTTSLIKNSHALATDNLATITHSAASKELDTADTTPKVCEKINITNVVLTNTESIPGAGHEGNVVASTVNDLDNIVSPITQHTEDGAESMEICAKNATELSESHVTHVTDSMIKKVETLIGAKNTEGVLLDVQTIKDKMPASEKLFEANVDKKDCDDQLHKEKLSDFVCKDMSSKRKKKQCRINKVKKKSENAFLQSRKILFNKRLDCLIVASHLHPVPLVMKLCQYVAPSRPIVVYCQYIQPLLELFEKLKESKCAINITISETWHRQYQVLPDRTHPEKSMNSIGGYLLLATTVLTS